MRRIVTALLLLCAGAANAGERLTVDQAVAAALAHNANVAGARLEVERRRRASTLLARNAFPR